MRYKLHQGLWPLENNERVSEADTIVEIITQREYWERYNNLTRDHQLMRMMNNIDHCKASIFKDYILGTFCIPDKMNLRDSEWTCGFYMDRSRLIFIGDVKHVQETIEQIRENLIVDMNMPEHMLFEFLECLIRDDSEYLDQYEASLDEKEDEMLEDVSEIPKDFQQYIGKTRKEMMILNRYYKQLLEVAKSLENCPNGILSLESKEMFRFFSDKAERLYADAQNLREYTIHIKDMYQSQIDVRQNKVMQFLTIITTVFMPLTLITGWYGMNFIWMPELKWQYSYLVIIILAVVIIIIELLIFKKKKWF